MAHPVYKLKSGLIVPSVTTIISNNLGWNKNALYKWNHSEGVAGRKFNQALEETAKSGTLAHYLVECEMKGIEPDYSPFKDLPQEQKNQGWLAYQNFLSWKQTQKIELVHSELSLVSEKHKFAGTLDMVCLLDDKLCLFDLKTSKGNSIYAEFLIQLLGGYAILWEENFPDKKVDGGYHFLKASKTSKSFVHKSFGMIPEAKEAFLLLLRLNQLKEKLTK